MMAFILGNKNPTDIHFINLDAFLWRFFFWLSVGNMLIACDPCDNSSCVDTCIHLSISERKSLYAHLHTIYDICNKLIVTDLSTCVQWSDFKQNHPVSKFFIKSINKINHK